MAQYLPATGFFSREYATDIRLVYFENKILRVISESETLSYFPINQHKQADIQHNHFVHNFKLPAPCKRDLRSCGILCRVDW